MKLPNLFGKAKPAPVEEQEVVQPTGPRLLTVSQEAVKVSGSELRVNIRCKWYMGYKVRATETPSGTEYIFGVNQVLPVEPQDVAYLLSLQKSGGGCCGSDPKPYSYFERSYV